MASTETVIEHIIVFARFPQPGQTKTRLIPAIGSENAASLQDALTRMTLQVVNHFCIGRNCKFEIRFTGSDLENMANRFGSEFSYVSQTDGNLGNRLKEAVEIAFISGANRVVVIGTDCPDMNPCILSEAFDSLSCADLVLGPALDGRYYLIGLRKNQPEIFREVDWGTGKVMEQTLRKARMTNLKISLLRPLSDLDHPEDLLLCRNVPDKFFAIFPPIQPGLISIVIPTLNEENNLKDLLNYLACQNDIEVIIADGGSSDHTLELAHKYGARTIRTPACRGKQMNAGAAISRGEALLFLHADTRLPPNFTKIIWSTLNTKAIAGAFRLTIKDSNPSLRFIEFGTNIRSRYLQKPYGDQGLFLKAETFFQIGGYPNWPLMEDYELCRRLRKRGKIALTPESVTTSARRWKKLGVFRTTLINQAIILGFHWGLAPERLAGWYTCLRKPIL